MEFLLVLVVVSVLWLVAVGGATWFWIAVLVAASTLGYRAYRVRCDACGGKVISGRLMRFCNQCGAAQPPGRGVRLRCAACGKLARSELNMSYCNQCGVAVKS